VEVASKHAVIYTLEGIDHPTEVVLTSNHFPRARSCSSGQLGVIHKAANCVCQGSVVTNRDRETRAAGKKRRHRANGGGNHRNARSEHLQCRDGKSFEVDLNRRNAAKLRKALEPYMSAGRRVGGRARKASAASANDTAAVRRWAESNGIEISKRGRIPRDIVAQYEAAGH